MKRKKYGSFALPRVIAGLVIGAVVFAVIDRACADRYNRAVRNGFQNIGGIYERILKGYDEGRTDGAFSSIICNFYQADYIRLARIRADGSFDTIYETDYDIIPVELSIHDWIYVTDDEELLSEENRHVDSVTNGFQIDYKRCGEIRTIRDGSEKPLIANSYYAVSMSDGITEGFDVINRSLDMIGWCCLPYLEVDSYCIDGDTLYLGEVHERTAVFQNSSSLRTWEFDMPGQNAGSAALVDGDVMKPQIMGSYVRPDDYLKAEGDLFLIQNLNDIDAMENSSKAEEFRSRGNIYSSEMYDPEGHTTRGLMNVLDIGEHRYLIEYVMTTASYTEYYKPCLIILAVLIFILAVGIPCLAAIRPYSQYRKAYENNEFKNNLIDSLAHNLKTPLQIIGGYAENLKDTADAREKAHYSDSILKKINEMNTDIEEILKTADKTNLVFARTSLRKIFEDASAKAGVSPEIKGDKTIKADRDYLMTAILCLIDNAAKYRTEDSDITVTITSKETVIRNSTKADKFTPGTGITITGRILEQHKLKLKTELKDGVFEARITKR